ncbi:MAG: ABC-F family ATPase [Betaproteobacteria bacterium RIFCSPHIGHO2_12_FULL_69_13]|nr:MAG: ABC-F family ATPase [Betaproteobacteria bacterium RIFCSPHIGHO2_12_FULL_69_13]OGA67453.1 MAG: ABC-F family ATPase [Betaproteobacteria bacterium RIFCSPLOWO2_12_FULL_68_20]
MIVASGIAMQFGAKPLFSNVSVKFGGGNRYGLIGANGCGKSTFMKILGGELEPSAGTVAIDSNERVGRLRQDQFAFEAERVLDVVLMGHAEMWAAMRERDAIYADPDAGEEELLRAAELEAKYAEYGGYTAEARAGELLLGLGVPAAQHDGPMSAVAPGWKLRVLLAQALFGDPDILLLDEPTNNLDINGIRWLEDVLNRRSSTMVIISHDRHFLSSVCTHMADVDYGAIRVYPGNYDDYMEASTLAKQQQEKDNAKARDRIADLEDFVRRFRAHKAKARQATSRMKQIEKLKVEDVKPSSRQYPFIRFLVDPKEKLHRLAVEAKGLFYGKLNLTIEAGEKVAVIGPNGVGKTHLLRCLAGQLKPDAGGVKWAEKARPGYWPQDPADEFKADETLTDWMGRWRRQDRAQDEQIVRATLGQMLFSGDDQKKPLRVISGGEAQRMIVGRLVLGMPNVMLLDEPTNHLDMESIESLNTALDKYTGTLVFVSHDRELISSLATRIIELRPGEVVDFRGSYEDYLAGASAALAAA